MRSAPSDWPKALRDSEKAYFAALEASGKTRGKSPEQIEADLHACSVAYDRHMGRATTYRKVNNGAPINPMIRRLGKKNPMIQRLIDQGKIR